MFIHEEKTFGSLFLSPYSHRSSQLGQADAAPFS